MGSIVLSSSISDNDVSFNIDDDEAETVATIRSVTLCNVPKDQEPELLCEFLMEVGACSTSIIDADRGTDLEQPLFGEPTASSDPWRDSVQWAAPVWNRCNVSAHFPSSIDLKGVVDLIADIFPGQYPLDGRLIEIVPNKDWVIHVQKSWKPITIGPYVLRFPWHTEKDIQKALLLRDDNDDGDNDNSGERIELKLQGGIAFGTGEHPTTQLCLEWIHENVRELLSSSPSEESFKVVDYGAGSGVLGMAACALDRERIHAVGIEIDVDAIFIANANAIDNGLSMNTYLPPLAETADHESKSLLMKAHARAQKQLDGLSLSDDKGTLNMVLSEDQCSPIYDIAVANILAGPLVALSPTIASLVRPGGRLAMSGILPQQDDMIIEAYSQFFDNVKVEREMGGWLLVTGTRRND